MPLVVRLFIVVALLAVIGSLALGLVRLVKDRGQSTRLVRALTFRIALSLALFLLLMIGIFAGIIVPHGVVP